jgi:hypothetical protein
MSVLHWLVACGLIAMGCGMVLVHLARNPPTMLTGMYLAACGAVLAVAAKVYELTRGDI